MGSFIKPITLIHAQFIASRNRHRTQSIPASPRASLSDDKQNLTHRRKLVTTFLATSLALGLHATPMALAENWGTRSFLKERFFEPGLSPEDAVARIRQTAEGLHSIRDMLETMSWRYVLFYIRLKSAYLSQDMKNAMSMVPEIRRKSYVKTANELVDNMSEFDYYVRTPKVYESYVYYEKTLKSIDELVALLA
ncbi:photosynthetic NDH subunit of lumenal location 2, chloroplastic [Cornus florida]|uniref:photosynthetic NDH subunit of lumenal location 2, chloroplastic n=1 Tax=Cornus florida TaxID=4283 RepID=UPI0028996F03|nr:photosynthetic NDH subunit of lumenal location 2, chloroplastic [Cornus florida]